MILISLHDDVACTWSTPVCVDTEQSAIRDFRTACSNSNSLIGQHPNDFSLWAVGEWHPSLDPDRRPQLVSLTDYKLLCRGEVPNEQ
jgi:hypothetical protein